MRRPLRPPVAGGEPDRAGLGRKIALWLDEPPIRVLNLVCPSEATQPGIGAEAEDVLRAVFALRGLRSA